jgi:hypothetical protein
MKSAMAADRRDAAAATSPYSALIGSIASRPAAFF